MLTDSCDSDRQNVGYIIAASALVLFVFLGVFTILLGIFIKKGESHYYVYYMQLCKFQTLSSVPIMSSV